MNKDYDLSITNMALHALVDATAYDKGLAIVFIKQLDRNCYNTLLNNLEKQFSLGTDQ